MNVEQHYGSYVVTWDTVGVAIDDLPRSTAALYLVPLSPAVGQFLFVGYQPGLQTAIAGGHWSDHDGLLRLRGHGVTVREGAPAGAATFRPFEHFFEPMEDGTLLGLPMQPGWSLLSARSPYVRLPERGVVPFHHPALPATWEHVEQGPQVVLDAEQRLDGPLYIHMEMAIGVAPSCVTTVRHPDLDHPLRLWLDRTVHGTVTFSAGVTDAPLTSVREAGPVESSAPVAPAPVTIVMPQPVVSPGPPAGPACPRCSSDTTEQDGVWRCTSCSTAVCPFCGGDESPEVGSLRFCRHHIATTSPGDDYGFDFASYALEGIALPEEETDYTEAQLAAAFGAATYLLESFGEDGLSAPPDEGALFHLILDGVTVPLVSFEWENSSSRVSGGGKDYFAAEPEQAETQIAHAVESLREGFRRLIEFG